MMEEPIEKPIEQEDNPFEAFEQNTNDDFLEQNNEQSAVLKQIFQDPQVSKPVKENNWHVFARTNILTFLKPDEIPMKMNQIGIVDDVELLNTPYSDYNYSRAAEKYKLRTFADSHFRRSVGTKENINNQMILISKQISEQHQFSENSNTQDNGSGGILGFLKRKK